LSRARNRSFCSAEPVQHGRAEHVRVATLDTSVHDWRIRQAAAAHPKQLLVHATGGERLLLSEAVCVLAVWSGAGVCKK